MLTKVQTSDYIFFSVLIIQFQYYKDKPFFFFKNYKNEIKLSYRVEWNVHRNETLKLNFSHFIIIKYSCIHILVEFLFI